MLRSIVSIVVSVTFVGCATPADKARQAVERQGPYCEAMGFQSNTDGWRDCIQRQEARRDNIIWGK